MDTNNSSSNVNDKILIRDDTTYSELMKILRSRPEAAKAAEVEQAQGADGQAT